MTKMTTATATTTVMATMRTGKTAAGAARAVTALLSRGMEVIVPISSARKTAKETLTMEEMEE